MKKFFKKIGRGLKKLGKGIMKVMSSKIGRIIGMVSLAFGVGSIFQAMYQGVAGGTAAGTAASTAASGAAAEVGKEAGIEAVAQGTVEAGKQEVLKTAAKETTQKALDTTLEGVVAQTNNLKQAAGAVTGDTLTSVASEGVAKAVANGGAEVATQGATFTPEVVSATTQQVGQQATQQTASSSMALQKDILTSADGAAATTAGTEARLTAVPDASKATESLLSAPSTAETKSLLADPNVMDTALQGESVASLTPESLTPSMETQIAEFKAMKPSTLRDSLKNPETRQLYESLVEPSKGLTDANNISLELTPAGQVQGVQEFSSFKEAYQAGNNPISGMGNVLGRAQTYDLGELTGGRLQGFAGEQGVFRTAQTASALLSPPEPVEMPSRNPYAAAEVATLSQIGATTAYQAPTMAMDFSNQMATGNVTNPFTTLNQIRQKAGFGNIYGSLNSMASMQVG